MSHSYIPWFSENKSNIGERHQEKDVIAYVLHPNGDWVFFVSSYNVLHILSLRTMRQVLEQSLGVPVPFCDFGNMAIELSGGLEVLLSVSVGCW
jgi:hypothetical protein